MHWYALWCCVGTGAEARKGLHVLVEVPALLESALEMLNRAFPNPHTDTHMHMHTHTHTCNTHTDTRRYICRDLFAVMEQRQWTPMQDLLAEEVLLDYR